MFLLEHFPPARIRSAIADTISTVTGATPFAVTGATPRRRRCCHRRHLECGMNTAECTFLNSLNALMVSPAFSVHSPSLRLRET